MGPYVLSVLVSLLAPVQEEDAPPPPQPEQQQQGLNAFNPQITVFANALLRLDNKAVIEVEGTEVIEKDDKFLLRETEVDFRASVDPYVDGVLIVALEQEVPGEFEVDVEEGYALIKSLPFGFWEEPPLGTTIKVGRFLASAGRINRLHTHDLPQSQRGLTVENFFGDHPYIVNGASASGFLPSFGESALTFTVEAAQGGGWEFAEDGTNQAAYLGGLSWFNTFGDEHDVEIGGFAWYGSNDDEGRLQAILYGAEFLYKWTPLEEGSWNSFLIAGQVFYGDREFFDAGPPAIQGTHRAVGGLAYAQYQLDRRWYVGVRGDWTELLENRVDEATRINPYVSCYISEFFRIRAGYEHTWSDDPALDDLDTFLLELNVVFGAHPPHPYWVNY